MSENKVNKVNIRKNPIWIKTNFVGKFNGIKFRFNYNEFTHEDTEDVIKTFGFTWPGRIPEDKEFAERGIKELFNTLRSSKESTIDMEVLKNADVSFSGTLDDSEELDALDTQIKEELNTIDNDEALQERFKGED